MKRLVLLFALLLTQSAFAQRYNYFSPGGALSCTGNCTQQSVDLSSGSFIKNTLPYVSLPSQPANTILGAISAGATTTLTPLQVSILQNAQLSAYVATTANITLSGAQTIDGQSVGTGQIVFVWKETVTSQNGIYVSATGAWTRIVGMPAGAVIGLNCVITVSIQQGTTQQGHLFALSTTGGALTVGTDPLIFADVISVATTTRLGAVTVSQSSAFPVSNFQGPGTAVGDCVALNDTVGTLTDSGSLSPSGVTGPCAITDQTGHLDMHTSGSTTVTGAGCSLNAGSFDGSGSVTATGINTCTVVFSGSFASAPHCAIGNHSITVSALLTASPTTAHAIFSTAAAGTFDYICL